VADRPGEGPGQPPQRRVQHVLGQLARGRAHGQPVAADPVVEAAPEVGPRGRQGRGVEAEGRRHPLRLPVEGVPGGVGQGLDEVLVGAERGVDEGRVHPEQEPGVEGVVGRARRVRPHRASQAAVDPGVQRVDRSRARGAALRRTEDQRQHRVEGAAQPAQRIFSEARVVGDARRHQGVGELEEQRARAGQQQHPLAIHPPHPVAGRVGHRAHVERPAARVGRGRRRRVLGRHAPTVLPGAQRDDAGASKDRVRVATERCRGIGRRLVPHGTRPWSGPLPAHGRRRGAGSVAQ